MEADVVADGGGEQDRVRGHITNVVTQPVQAVAVHRLAIQQDLGARSMSCHKPFQIDQIYTEYIKMHLIGIFYYSNSSLYCRTQYTINFGGL